MKKLLLIVLVFVGFTSNAQELKDSLYMYQGDVWAFTLPSFEQASDSDSLVFNGKSNTYIYAVDSCYMYWDISVNEYIYGCMILRLANIKEEFGDSLFVYSEDVWYLSGRKISSKEDKLPYYDSKRNNNQ